MDFWCSEDYMAIILSVLGPSLGWDGVRKILLQYKTHLSFLRIFIFHFYIRQQHRYSKCSKRAFIFEQHSRFRFKKTVKEKARLCNNALKEGHILIKANRLIFSQRKSIHFEPLGSKGLLFHRPFSAPAWWLISLEILSLNHGFNIIFLALLAWFGNK